MNFFFLLLLINPRKLKALGGFSTVGVGTVGLVNTCVFGFWQNFKLGTRRFLPCPDGGWQYELLYYQ